MFYVSPKHIELLEAVNNAKTELDHMLAEERLCGYREGMDDCGVDPGRMGCDLYYMDQGIDRPTCCGVWLDWEPATQPPAESDDPGEPGRR